MTRRTKIWLIPTLLYAGFVFWYTDFGGPLKEQEIAQFMDRMRERGVTAEGLANIEKFMREDTGRQFLMLNIADYNENPPPVAGAAPTETAQQLMDRYMGYMYRELLIHGCHPTVMGGAVFRAMDVVGQVASQQHRQVCGD